jgi:tetratricopeptide (TPR) repeat protein
MLGTFALSAALLVPQAFSAVHFFRGQSELRRYHSDAALAHFEAALRVWPHHEQSRLLASRSARRLGQFDVAAMHLQRCQDANASPSPELTMEWSCLRATEGDLVDVESYLYDQLRANPQYTLLIWEALAEGYIRACRTADALKCLNQWLERDGNNVQALILMGNLHQDVHAHALAADNFAKALALDDERDDARRRLAVSLMAIGRYQDALQHLEILQQRLGDNPDVLVREAHCHDNCDHAETALVLLDKVLVVHPGYGPALRTRGQLELARQRPEEAEVWLRQAIAAMPYDYASHYALFNSLRAQNKTAEKLVQEEHMRQLKDRLERISEITSREISLRPRDAALQLELGKLLLSVGRKGEGYFWLRNAEKIDPQSRTVCLALADFYHDAGDAEQETIYRERALALPDDEPKSK